VIAAVPDAHADGVSEVAWRPDGRRLASAGGDGLVKVWDRAGRLLRTLGGRGNPAYTVCWSPDGRRLASGGFDGLIRLWDAESGRALGVLSGHLNAVRKVDWSPDGRRLASGGDDQTVKVWDAETGQETATLRGHDDTVWYVRWSPDGLRLASGGEDRTLRLWDATPGYAAERSPALLPGLDQRLKARPDAADRKLRAEALARQGRWDEAAAGWIDSVLLGRGESPLCFEAGWWVAGPFADDAEAPAFDLEPDPLAPVRGFRGDGPDAEPPRWCSAPIADNGCLDLGALYPRAGDASVHALLRVYAPKERRAAVLLGGAGRLRVWLNGRPLHEADRGRPPSADDAVPLTLRAGWNTLLVRVGLRPGADRLTFWLSGEPADRARALAERGRWDEAAAELTAAVERRPGDPALAAQRLLALRQVGDADGCCMACAAVLERFGEAANPRVAGAAARACVVAPGAVADPGLVVHLAEKALAKDRDWIRLRLLGAALVRAGEADRAVERLTEGMQANPEGGDAPDWLWLALAHQQKGRADEARRWLARAVERLEAKEAAPSGAALGWTDRLESRLLRREAEALMASGGR
jgi:tetratricopeptide (TPR) repeat protein